MRSTIPIAAFFVKSLAFSLVSWEVEKSIIINEKNKLQLFLEKKKYNFTLFAKLGPREKVAWNMPFIIISEVTIKLVFSQSQK